MSTTRVRVSFQGELGAFGEMAIVQHWRGGADAVPTRTFASVADLVRDAQVEYGVIPVWNSSIGDVLQGREVVDSMDAGLETDGEVAVPVHHCLLALPGSTIEAVLDATNGRGADSVIDAVASNITLDTALSCVRPNGTVSVIGVHDLTPYPLPILVSLLRSITLRLTTAPVHQTWKELVPLVANGELRTDGIVTNRLRLDDAAEGYRLAASRSADCMKVAFTP